MSSKRVQFTPRGMELTYDGGGTDALSEVTYADLPSGSGTWAATPTISGALTLTAGQIIFPATQNASTNANTLDDYEERIGTPWVPVIGGSGGTSGQSYSAQTGYSVKIGRLWVGVFYAALSAKGTITGAVQIQGLPHAITDVMLVSPYFEALATNWIMLGGRWDGGTAISLQGLQAAAATSAALTTSDIGNTTGIRGIVVGITTT